MQQGSDGAALTAIRGRDFSCTVTGTTPITKSFLRVHLSGATLLQAIGNHPTMWARFWFRCDGRRHQRAFTLINADRSAGTFDIDVHLHEGTSAIWAKTAQPGTMIDATLQD